MEGPSLLRYKVPSLLEVLLDTHELSRVLYYLLLTAIESRTPSGPPHCFRGPSLRKALL